MNSNKWERITSIKLTLRQILVQTVCNIDFIMFENQIIEDSPSIEARGAFQVKLVVG